MALIHEYLYNPYFFIFLIFFSEMKFFLAHQEYYPIITVYQQLSHLCVTLIFQMLTQCFHFPSFAVDSISPT